MPSVPLNVTRSHSESPKRGTSGPWKRLEATGTNGFGRWGSSFPGELRTKQIRHVTNKTKRHTAPLGSSPGLSFPVSHRTQSQEKTQVLEEWNRRCWWKKVKAFPEAKGPFWTLRILGPGFHWKKGARRVLGESMGWEMNFMHLSYSIVSRIPDLWVLGAWFLGAAQ